MDTIDDSIGGFYAGENHLTLPGKADIRGINKKIYSYYVHNQKEVLDLLEKIYNVRK